MPKYYKYIKIILIFIPILFFIYLLNKQFPWNGKLEIIYDFKKPNAFIGKLNPAARLSEIQNVGDNYFQIMNIDPAYFTVELPANYETIEVELKYQSKNQPIIQIGGLANKDIWNFQTIPIQNSIIDELSDQWHKIQKENTIFLQKEKQYDSIQAFLDNLPPINEISIFNYHLPYEYIYPNYQASEKYIEINQPIKGKHSFYTYIGEEEAMDFSFWLEDINEYQGNDAGSIEVYKGTKLIKRFDIKDDNIDDNSKIKTKLQKLDIQLNNIENGLYKINLLLTDDILVKKIKTKQNLITFIDKLNLYNSEKLEIPLKLTSNISNLKVATNDILGLQTIKIGKEETVINDVNTEYVKNITENKFNIEIPKGNIIIQGAGLLSFEKKYFFDPTITILDNKNKLEKINYVIANYESLVSQLTGVNNWKVGKAKFKLGHLHKEKNKVKIMISAPNLDKNKGEIKIGEIKVNLIHKPLLNRIINKLKILF